MSLEGVNGGLFKPKKSIDFDIAKDILNDFLGGSYNKDKYFSNEECEKTDNLKKEEILDAKEYQVFRLCAITPLLKTISSNIGGVIYDEPAFAVVAALNVSKNKIILPIAEDYNIYKILLRSTLKGLKKADFFPNSFQKAEMFFDSNNLVNYDAKPIFDVISIKGEDLKRIQGKGRASFLFEDELRCFELYASSRV